MGEQKTKRGWGWCKFREVLSVKSAARTETESGTGRRFDLETIRKPARIYHGRLSKNIRIICNSSANTKGWPFNVFFWPLRPLVAGLWNRRPWFFPRPTRVEFVTEEMAQGQFISLRWLWYYRISITPLIIHNHKSRIYNQNYVIFVINNFVK